MIDRLLHGVYRGLSAAVRPLPLPVCCRIGAALGTLACYLFPRYRRLAMHNLQIAFGKEKSPAHLRQLTREHFATLGANLLASLKIAALPPDEIRAIVTIEGLDILRRTVDSKRGFVGVISHLGNWELLSQISLLIFGCPGGAVYQRLGNALMDAEVRKSRARMGVELFERKEGFQGAMQMLRAGGAVGVLVDQHAGDAGVWCPFFGRLASTSSLAATLAMRTGAVLLPMAVFSDGPGHWRMVIELPIETTTKSAGQISAQINQTLETQIRRQPADWFWVHNRWKTPKPKFLLATYKRGVIPGTAAPLQPFRILIRASNWLGDAVMSAPAVRAIKRGRPDAHVTILTPQKLADFWHSVSEVDEIISIERADNLWKVAAKIRAGKFDAAVIFPNSLRTGLEPFLGGVPRRVGYPGHRRAALLNQVYREKKRKLATPASAAATHQVHHYLALAGFIGADITDVQVRPVEISDAGNERAPVIGLCAGAEYGGAKRWLPERFAEVMSSVHERYGCEWKLFGVAKDREITDRILSAAAIPATDLVGKTTLAELIAQLRTCDLLLTNDTGTMHLAASLGIRVVALFGSTEPALTGPLGQGHRILREPVSCSPCFLRECPIDFRCMKAISVEQVKLAIDGLLESRVPCGSGGQQTPVI